MITWVPFEQQFDSAGSDDLRILVVGAGIAGISVAQLLRRQGRHPVLIERSRDPETMTDDDHAGYMLALMPMVDSVFDDLGVREDYREASVPIDRYALHSHTGKTLRSDRLGALLAEYGEYRGISRGELITVLSSAPCPVTFDTSLVALSGAGDGAESGPTRVQVATGVHSRARVPHEAEFDLVIIADGLGSHTRQLVPGGGSESSVDTAWGGWVAWAPADADTDQVDELWGDGFFLGAYPVKDRIGIFLGGPDSREPLGARRFAEEVRSKLATLTPRIDAALTAVSEADDPYFWALRDFRSSQWATGSTVLLGDAAAGFLPTAGIGAGMSMESARMLAASLETASRRQLPGALRGFETAQRPRVEQAQTTSRQLAEVMFHLPRFLVGLRGMLFCLVSVKTALGPIIDLLKHPARPDEVRSPEV
ncbi:FAD-dependent oxidoreductase [Brevibacterium marinum]|uniref:2-polyprenyl-6-methoxyphenol hydroxylase-like FAD-dependent oxidoreductase n=1 Tax=Brevibacterium marinum TaxID=418643 RepID=A0A846S4D5_9MICO|nr:NAD(P)/FAD-dependent oxidoreductase [Brevibacterium marinum]NJC57848.1 2-polyprenyl-6-methoxyphenol hydroxylase-like FAD-dependent oxidoreductase [Brevibacterium marinum]